jgi:hypothetical protein
MRVDKLVTGFSLLALAGAAVAARDPIGELLAQGGNGEHQRALAGGTAGRNARIDRPLRVVLLDGLSRADAPRLPALTALCERGAELVVDVGFPTKSLPVQRVLWSGLTAQQQGDRADNETRSPPTSSIPLSVPRSFAISESHPEIATDAGFALAEWSGDLEGDAFASAAAWAVAAESPLVFVHVLAIDTAAHAHGRRGAGYADALTRADEILAASLAAAPDAQWLVVADHGHVVSGGHGDAEDEVRRVVACITPAPRDLDPAARDAEIHLVDLSRWIADAVTAPRHPYAVGRTLAVATAHPDRDATLPRAGALRTVLAILLALAGIACGVMFTRPRWAAAWPLVSVAAIAILHGLPTLSHRPSALLLGLCGLIPAAAAAVRARTHLALLAPAGGCVAAFAVMSRMPQLLVGSVAHVPWWTALAAAGGMVLAGGMAGIGLVSVVSSRSAD